MRVLITGVKGQLGFDVLEELTKDSNKTTIGIDLDVLDLTDEYAVKLFLRSNQPDVIVHCAAYTAVDNAELEKNKCFDVNVNSTKYLNNYAIKENVKFIYISTDYVFSGDKVGRYEITDKTDPKSVYGLSKYRGELETQKNSKHFIIRTSWVFGRNGHNFVKTMLKLSTVKNKLEVVSDQNGSPTYTKDLAKFICRLINTEKYGTYHVTNEGYCSWFQFAKEIFKLSGAQTKLSAINTSEYPTLAVRPRNSRLSKNSLLENGFELLPSWQDALERYLKEIEVI